MDRFVIKASVMKRIIHELNNDEVLKKLFRKDRSTIDWPQELRDLLPQKRVSKFLLLVAEGNDLKIEERGIVYLNEEETKLFLERLDHVIELCSEKKDEEQKVPEIPKRIDPLTGTIASLRETHRRREPQLGEYIGRIYRIKDIIDGGMGRVYIANAGIGDVAIKSFREEDSWEKLVREKLKDEAYTWVKLGRHPNIVEAKVIKEYHGKLYIIMEFIDGGDLSFWMRKKDLDLNEILDLAIQFCHGMEFASESLNMVHRDIKPGNILITSEGNLKITDFGVASSIHGGTFGSLTLPFASPEQFMEIREGKKIADTRSDIYSFGIVLYYMLTGKRPFNARNQREWMEIHLSSKPVSPISINPFVPKKLNGIVMRCLSKDPRHRYKSFKQLKEALMETYTIVTGKRYELPPPPRETGIHTLKLKGESMQYLGKYDDAIKYYQRALERDPKSVPALNGTALAYRGKEDFTKAILYHDKALELEWTGTLLNEKGITLWYWRNNDDALKCFNEALRLNRYDDEAWSNKGMVLSKMGFYEEAINCYEKAIEIDPQNEHSWNNKATNCNNLKRYDEAIKCCKEAFVNNPQFEPAWENMAFAYVQLKDWYEVARCCKVILELNENNHNAPIWLKKAKEELGKFDREYELEDISDSLGPHYWNNKGDSLYKKDRFKEALECYDKAIKIDPEFGEAWNNKGNVLVELKRYPEAIECYLKSVELNPRMGYRLFNLAHAYWLNKDHSEALKYSERALAIDKKDARSWNIKGLALSGLKRPEEAVECFMTSLDINPEYVPAWNNLAIELMDAEEYNAALFCINSALEIEPNYEKAWHNGAIVHYRLKNWEEVIVWCEKLLEINPLHKFARKWIKEAKEELGL